MKRFVCILCMLMMVIGMLAVTAASAATVDAAQTVVEVKEGDEVAYTLKLSGVPDVVIGTDYTIYYDSSMLKVVSAADFTNSTDEKEWQAMMNYNLDGRVRGSFSILSGVDFTEERNYVTINFKAIASGSTHISYFISYLYDNNIFNSDDKEQITQYKFTCDVKVNGETVIENAQPELNTVETQASGNFVNSLTGDSKDADPDIPGTVAKRTDSNTSSAAGNNTAANNSSGGNTTQNGNADSAGSKAGEQTADSAAATTAEGYYITATDAEGNVLATSDQAPLISTNDDGADNGNGGSSPVLWIIIALIVLAGGGAGAYYFMKNKKPEDTGDKA